MKRLLFAFIILCVGFLTFADDFDTHTTISRRKAFEIDVEINSDDYLYIVISKANFKLPMGTTVYFKRRMSSSESAIGKIHGLFDVIISTF